jgi:hypothetical protein
MKIILGKNSVFFHCENSFWEKTQFFSLQEFFHHEMKKNPKTPKIFVELPEPSKNAGNVTFEENFNKSLTV